MVIYEDKILTCSFGDYADSKGEEKSSFMGSGVSATGIIPEKGLRKSPKANLAEEIELGVEVVVDYSVSMAPIGNYDVFFEANGTALFRKEDKE